MASLISNLRLSYTKSTEILLTHALVFIGLGEFNFFDSIKDSNAIVSVMLSEQESF